MYYQVQIALDQEFTDIVVNKVVENMTDYEVAKDLEPYTVYWWRVKAINPLTGAESAWSAPCAFRVKAADVTIDHKIDKHTCQDILGTGIGDGNSELKNSYIIYTCGEHKFVRSYDSECIIPDAQIGVGMCDTSGTANIGVEFCPGVCVPVFDGLELEYILTENNQMLTTEDGVGLVLDFQLI